MSREGLRILQANADVTLKNWEKNQDCPDVAVAEDLREASREASDRLREAAERDEGRASRTG